MTRGGGEQTMGFPACRRGRPAPPPVHRSPGAEAPADPDDDLQMLLAGVLLGRPVNIIQRGPAVYVDATGPMTATSAWDLACHLLPAVRAYLQQHQSAPDPPA